jgi:hypothetical protein
VAVRRIAAATRVALPCKTAVVTLPRQLPCLRREQLFQFRVGGVAGIVWVSQLFVQGVEHRAGGLYL